MAWGSPGAVTLAIEVAMWRIGGELPPPLGEIDTRGMIPAGVDDGPARWKPAGGSAA